MRAIRIAIRGLGCIMVLAALAGAASGTAQEPASRKATTGQSWWKPYSAPCTERENVFVFTEKPAVKLVSKDKYEIAFAVKGNCDVTVGLIGEKGVVVRHLGSGVLGANAPAPFQKNSLKQKIYWNGKNDLGYYVKEPDKLRVRVMLGLKPTFDKRLGGTSPKNFPGYICAIAIGSDAAYVFSKKWRMHVRKFDRDGNYIMSLMPPPANLPESKLPGMGYVEYEPGKRALHAPVAYDTVTDRGRIFKPILGATIGDFQPVLIGRRLAFCGFPAGGGRDLEEFPAPLYFLHTDGSTDPRGVRGIPFSHTAQRFPRLAASPDGKWLYMTGAGSSGQFGVGGGLCAGVMRYAFPGDKPAVAFLGKSNGKKIATFSPGAEPGAFNGACGIDCDASGRIYVADGGNSRIQIFSADGKQLKSISIDRPMLLQVHKKTGALYVTHAARVRGQSLSRLTKLGSFEDPTEVFHVDNLGGAVMALDSWSPKPRIWIAGEKTKLIVSGDSEGSMQNVRIFEETGKTLRKIADFEEDSKKEDGDQYFGRWWNAKGGGSTPKDKLVCDPVRERAYYHGEYIFDLKTGRYLRRFLTAPHRVIYDDCAIDKRGYMHVHFNPGFYAQAIARIDPSQARAYTGKSVTATTEYYPEVPYDYGVERVVAKEKRWKGVIPTRDQPGAHFFQMGIGVNMLGDVAEVAQIYYVPKLEDSVMSMLNEGAAERRQSTGFASTGGIRYADFMRRIEDQQKRGEKVSFIKRRPGLPLSGSTIWTFDRTGELRDECAVIAGGLINGCQIDEEGKLYFTIGRGSRIRQVNGKPFLKGRGGTLGDPEDAGNRNPITGTYMKTRANDVRVLMHRSPYAPIPLDPLPDRPMDVVGLEESRGGWVEGAEWMYAGASPITWGGCKCPQMRCGLDWYKRSFVTEAYRHSIGILDTNGNLIMHVGRYGNFDSADGAKSKIPVGGDNISVFHPRAVSTTDNYMVFDSWGERLMVLKLDYHAEETVGISASR